MKPLAIPRRTREELANPAAPGSRHVQMIKVALSMIGNCLSPEAVFAELRGKYDHSVSDAEIRGIVKWTCRRNPKPSGYATRDHNSPAPRHTPTTVTSATAAVERFLRGFRCNEADLWHASPWRPLEHAAFDALLIFAGLFDRGELVNVCVEHGVGVTKSREAWLAHIRENGAPSGSIGCMFRPNPVSGKATGDKGGWRDADVTAQRFAVLESDLLPLDLQLSVIARLPLPVAAIIFSGGKSYHAVLRVDAPNAVAYRRDVVRILELLRPLGFDPQTGNPSRMSRLPGAMRGEKQQKLFYLNPDAEGEAPIFGGAL